MKKFLFIDDDKELLTSIRRIFREKENVYFAECHSVQEALDTVANIQPDIIFLDHSLTKGSDEGLEIAKALQGHNIKIYSTTSHRHLGDVYSQYGIEVVGKMNLVKIKKLVS